MLVIMTRYRTAGLAHLFAHSDADRKEEEENR